MRMQKSVAGRQTAAAGDTRPSYEGPVAFVGARWPPLTWQGRLRLGGFLYHHHPPPPRLVPKRLSANGLARSLFKRHVESPTFALICSLTRPSAHTGGVLNKFTYAAGTVFQYASSRFTRVPPANPISTA
ncbi:hypothetical protein GWI33_016340 [Rhynchophorus ferrugineus]|uniref:Uncharacterized protein n=1 Tax=Rhynchophorus ferrugineus TaxID=354439 RepID=A0A834M769_RHYFE|nr:hypothetical protein GWI33_016340 [Rhynchophorus ferrugineus]